MASRRDELNAYTFAKKRLVAQFLQPSPSGTEEGAPRPLRAVVPGAVIGVVIMAGFGAWGMFQPSAPKGWDEAKAQVLIGSKSTTRYVVLMTDGKKQLHPVLNYASARLLLDEQNGEKITKVDEKVLDSGKVPHGATLGIPYAPDRLPDEKQASAPKRWAVCEKAGQGGRSSQKAAFVFGEREMKKVEGPNKLRGGQLSYVQSTDNTQYIVDGKGTKYPLAEDPDLVRSLAGDNEPQRVSQQWLNTLHTGEEIRFPDVSGTTGAQSSAQGTTPDGQRLKVGMVLQARNGSYMQKYVVTQNSVMPVTDFMAQLLLDRPQAVKLGQGSKATDVSLSAIHPTPEWFGGNVFRTKWPQKSPYVVNSASPNSGRNTTCNVLRHVDGKGNTTLSTWVGKSYPATLPAGSTSAYVTPGSGQLFRQIQGTDTKSGGVFLTTDNGLRYAMQSNSDATGEDAGIGSGGDEKAKKQQAQEGQQAQIRLGYKGVKPAPIPYTWAQYLPTGPRMSTADARQPQGS
ncbi:type VII secretion protein EccB [Streptomyces sp. ODS28]|uniref:type VII secretion protein EccB n=1 Tax=Streptomyces sp. ODS28 TaxID=3136688 RepID=UPI0031EFFCE8